MTTAKNLFGRLFRHVTAGEYAEALEVAREGAARFPAELSPPVGGEARTFAQLVPVVELKLREVAAEQSKGKQVAKAAPAKAAKAAKAKAAPSKEAPAAEPEVKKPLRLVHTLAKDAARDRYIPTSVYGVVENSDAHRILKAAKWVFWGPSEAWYAYGTGGYAADSTVIGPVVHKLQQAGYKVALEIDNHNPETGQDALGKEETLAAIKAEKAAEREATETAKNEAAWAALYASAKASASAAVSAEPAGETATCPSCKLAGVEVVDGKMGPHASNGKACRRRKLETVPDPIEEPEVKEGQAAPATAWKVALTADANPSATAFTWRSLLRHQVADLPEYAGGLGFMVFKKGRELTITIKSIPVNGHDGKLTEKRVRALGTVIRGTKSLTRAS